MVVNYGYLLGNKRRFFINKLFSFYISLLKMVKKSWFVQIFTWIQHGKFAHDLHELRILDEKWYKCDFLEKF